MMLIKLFCNTSFMQKTDSLWSPFFVHYSVSYHVS